MTVAQAILLGLVQGLTEFLPVSSSGHLVIFQHLLGINQPPIIFDILVHIATLVAIIIVFWEEIKKINANFSKAIILGTIPTGLVGLFLNDYSETLFGSVKLVGIALLVTSFILFSTKLINTDKKKTNNINGKTAVLVGIAQGLAIIPGISRSGSTVITSMWLKLEQKTALAFSFLLSIPAILGAQILQMSDLSNFTENISTSYLFGFFTALFSGWISLKIFKSLVAKSKLHFFGFYTLIIALLAIFS